MRIKAFFLCGFFYILSLALGWMGYEYSRKAVFIIFIALVVANFVLQLLFVINKNKEKISELKKK